MPPNIRDNEIINEETDNIEKLVAPQAAPRKYELVYEILFIFIYIHAAGLYGLYLCCTSAKWATIFLNFILYHCAMIGFTAGAHRLWSHKAYKAKLPLQIILMLFESIACQYTVINWVRDHRVHHKYTDTDADPHNSTRGFFFSQIGWAVVKKHELVRMRGKDIDISDVLSNPVLVFQKKFSILIIPLMCVLLPTIIPMYFWGETYRNAYYLACFRLILNIHATSLVNSAAHMWGTKPYDKDIRPTQNVAVSIVAAGEGFHNYHHVFPWDYRAAELGNNNFNLASLFIDFFAWIGWAYDLKTVSDDMIRLRAERTGDGTELVGSGKW